MKGPRAWVVAFCSLLPSSCAGGSLRREGDSPDRESAEITFHVLGLMKTPSGAT